MSVVDELIEELEAAKSRPPKRVTPGQWIKRFAATITFLAGAASAVASAIEYRENHRKERHEAAERAYAEADQKYMDFLKLCLDRPRLDCYSTERPLEHVSPDDVQAQRVLDTMLIDVLEFAYKRYHDEFWKDALQRAVDEDWSGWDSFVRKFLARPHFARAWCTVRDEYGKGFVEYMDGLHKCDAGSTEQQPSPASSSRDKKD